MKMFEQELQDRDAALAERDTMMEEEMQAVDTLLEKQDILYQIIDKGKVDKEEALKVMKHQTLEWCERAQVLEQEKFELEQLVNAAQLELPHASRSGEKEATVAIQQ